MTGFSDCFSWLRRCCLRRSDSVRPALDMQGAIQGASGSGSRSLAGRDSESSIGPSPSGLGCGPDTPNSNTSQNSAQGVDATYFGGRPRSLVSCSPSELERLRQQQSNISSARNPIPAAAGVAVG